MISRVRIAPIEQWCQEKLTNLERNPAGAKFVGVEVEILTDSMVVDVEHGKKWLLTAESVQRLHDIARTPMEVRMSLSAGALICEHMLEMD